MRIFSTLTLVIIFFLGVFNAYADETQDLSYFCDSVKDKIEEEADMCALWKCNKNNGSWRNYYEERGYNYETGECEKIDESSIYIAKYRHSYRWWGLWGIDQTGYRYSSYKYYICDIEIDNFRVNKSILGPEDTLIFSGIAKKVDRSGLSQAIRATLKVKNNSTGEEFFIWSDEKNKTIEINKIWGGGALPDGKYTATLAASTINEKCEESDTLHFEIKRECNAEITNFSGSNSTLDPKTGGRVLFNFSAERGYDSYEITVAGRKLSGSSWDGRINGKIVAPGSYTAKLKLFNGDCTDIETISIRVESTNDCKLKVVVGSSANVAGGELTDNLNLFNSTGIPDIGLNLSYGSQVAYDGPLGVGWIHNYDIAITENLFGEAILRLGTGNSQLYRPGANNAYLSQATDYSTLIKNQIGGWTRTLKNGETQYFNVQGRIVTQVDRNGNELLFSYDNQGNLQTVNDGNRSIGFSYDGNNKLTQVSDPAGNTYSFSVGTTLNSVTFPDGSTTSYGYDGNAFLVTKTDPSGNLTTYNYDDNYRVVSSTDPMGRVRTLEYPIGDETIRSTSLTEKDGSVWQYRYDTQSGDLLGKTDPQGGDTGYTYDGMHNLLSKTGPAGTTAYTYDNQGNMLTVTDVAGNKTEYSYNEFGQVTSITNDADEATVYAYDSRGNLLKVTDPQGNSTAYQYDEQGRLIGTTNAGGLTTSLTYDDRGNVESITGADGVATTFTYDANGNRSSMTDGQGKVTRYEYDLKGQLIKVVDASDQSTSYLYDANGNRSSVTDANGKTTTFEYNFEGQMIRMTDAMGYVTSFAYGGSAGCSSCGGGVDRLTALTDAKGQTTMYNYNALGSLIMETDPQGHRTSYDYNAAGRVASKTDPNGNTVQYGYDTLGRLTSKTYPNGDMTTFSYDLEGNLLAAGNKNISYSFTYDASDRLTSVTDSAGIQIYFAYDASGNRTSLSSSNGIDVSYLYDDVGRLARISSQAGDISLGYDDLGRRNSLAFPNGVSTTYTYDDLSRLKALLTATGSGIIAQNHYTHDAVGNRMSNQDARNTVSYSYDDIYRLTEAKSNTPGNSPAKGKIKGTSNATDNQKEFYSYDPVGNRITSSEHNTYSHNKGNELLSADAATYTYDANGNRTSKTTPNGTTTYSWSYENRLTQVTMPDGQTISYAYDPFGRRINKAADDITTTYTYDGEDILFETVNGVLGNAYIHGPGIDEPLALVGKKGTAYYHADGLGSIVAMTDNKTKVVQSYEYDSYGNLNDMKNRIKQPYTYTGREYDRETGLYYYRARYYDAEVGRFLTKDPISFAGGDINLYNYVRNDPILLIDPYGLDWREFTKNFIKNSTGALNPDPIITPLAEIALSKETFTTGVLLAVKDYNQERALSGNFDFIDPSLASQNPYKALEKLVNLLNEKNSCSPTK